MALETATLSEAFCSPNGRMMLPSPYEQQKLQTTETVTTASAPKHDHAVGRADLQPLPPLDSARTRALMQLTASMPA
eukprot:6358031-Amphidinium_carterae.1